MKYAFKIEKRESENTSWTAGSILKKCRDSLAKLQSKRYHEIWIVGSAMDGSDKQEGERKSTSQNRWRPR